MWQTEPMARDATLLAERAPRVMLAEADPLDRRALATRLEEAGCDVVVARDAEQLAHQLGAFARAQVFPDVIVIDVRAPGRSELDLLGLVRETQWTTPVVVALSEWTGSARDAAEDLGATAILRRPARVLDVRDAVLQILDGREP
jgi:CheY-like chemotaxis protein